MWNETSWKKTFLCIKKKRTGLLSLHPDTESVNREENKRIGGSLRRMHHATSGKSHFEYYSSNILKNGIYFS